MAGRNSIAVCNGLLSSDRCRMQLFVRLSSCHLATQCSASYGLTSPSAILGSLWHITCFYTQIHDRRNSSLAGPGLAGLRCGRATARRRAATARWRMPGGRKALPDEAPDRRAQRLQALGVETLICGAISRPLEALLAAGRDRGHPADLRRCGRGSSGVPLGRVAGRPVCHARLLRPTVSGDAAWAMPSRRGIQE